MSLLRTDSINCVRKGHILTISYFLQVISGVQDPQFIIRIIIFEEHVSIVEFYVLGVGSYSNVSSRSYSRATTLFVDRHSHLIGVLRVFIHDEEDVGRPVSCFIG